MWNYQRVTTIDDIFPLIPPYFFPPIGENGGLAAKGPRADGGRDHSLHGGGESLWWSKVEGRKSMGASWKSWEIHGENPENHRKKKTSVNIKEKSGRGKMENPTKIWFEWIILSEMN